MDFKKAAEYWSEKVYSTDDHNFYIICDKSKLKPFRWEVLDKKDFQKSIGPSFEKLEQVEKNLEEHRAKLVAEKI